METEMTTIRIDLAGHGYDIVIDHGGLHRSHAHLAGFAQGGRLICVADENSAHHWLGTLSQGLEAEGIKLESLILPAGEATKSWRQLERLTDWLLDHHVERSTHILALGGGVIGDLVGFAAAIVKRGCRFVQIPTTLLSQVDSSVGGKTAINSKSGKNLIGAFHQPDYVLIDPAVLGTLPMRQLRAGFAEVIKYGLIDDPAFFHWCETNHTAFFAGERAAREQAIAASVGAKARVVEQDEKELSGTRALLNLGHTFGHALEAETGFSERLLHGEGVAAGMALAFRYSARIGLCPMADADRVTALLHAVNLPASLQDCGITAAGRTLTDHMLHDKKMSGGTLPFLLARGIGQTFLSKDVDLADIARFLDEEQHSR